MNIVVLSGSVVTEPEPRSLADGSCRWSFDLATEVPTERGGSERIVVPIAWAGEQLAAGVGAGADVVVVGRVRRRFFRAGGATASRTEVAALDIVAATRRRPLAAALVRAAGVLGGDERATLRSFATG